MNPGTGSKGSADLARLQKIERILAWTLSFLAVVMTACYFTMVGAHWSALDQLVWGTRLTLGTALGFICLFTFIAMIAIFTVISNKLERAQRS